MTRPPLLPSALTFREPVDEETRLANHGCMWVNYALSLETLVQSLVNAATPMVHILPAIAAQPEFDQSETKQRINEIVICGDVALAQAAELGFTPKGE